MSGQIRVERWVTCVLLALTGNGLMQAQQPAAAHVPDEQTIRNNAVPCLEPPPLVKWQEYRGPLKKAEGVFARKLERKSVPLPRYKPDTLLCSLEVKYKFKLLVQDTFDPVSFLSSGFNAGLDQATNRDPAFGQGAVVGHYWWYHSTPITHRVFSEHWNPHWGTPNRAWVRGNVNAYSHWAGNAVATRTFEQQGRALPQGRGTVPDLYVGRGGQLYQHRSDGWYQRNTSGQWQRTPSNPELEEQRQSRSLGQSRQREFENRGQAPGVFRTMGPPRGAPPRPAAPSRGPGRD